jgi:pyruvate/2-oxoacid:ferredoxin oxidoreductase alpha subunit
MGQGDLFLALYSAFWETSPIVFAPSNFKECYEMSGDALNYSDQYQQIQH